MAVPLLAAAVAIIGLLVVGLGIFVYQALRQQGRLLLRLEATEQSLSELYSRSLLPITAARNGRETKTRGIPVGAAVPPFHLPSLTGKPLGLDDFHGRKLLLINWSPACGFCLEIADDLAKLQRGLVRNNVELLLACYGDADSNLRVAEGHELTCPIILQQEGKPLEAFEQMGTPAAYLLDGEGRVATPVAVGADEVRTLAHDAVKQEQKRLPSERPLSESRIERAGLMPGTPAPSFSLSDLHGNSRSMSQYRGRRLLLVFSDPQCGPCNALLPDLIQLHHQDQKHQLQFLMISRGALEENLRKAEDYGVDFPVVIQPQWKISKEYGIFATPVAFLIDEAGIIIENVAKGRDEIVDLIKSELALEKEGVEK